MILARVTISIEKASLEVEVLFALGANEHCSSRYLYKFPANSTAMDTASIPLAPQSDSEAVFEDLAASVEDETKVCCCFAGSTVIAQHRIMKK